MPNTVHPPRSERPAWDVADGRLIDTRPTVVRQRLAEPYLDGDEDINVRPTQETS